MDGAPAEASDEPEVPPVTGDAQADGLLAGAAAELDAAARELQQAVDRADRAEAALASLEGLVDVLLDRIDRPVIVLDAELRVTGWTAGAEKCWSRPAADAVGRRWSRLGRSIDPTASANRLDELVLEGSPGDMVPFGDSLEVQLVGEGDVVRYVVVTQADT